MSTLVDVRPGFDLDDIRECLKLNLCRICRQAKEAGRERKHYCEPCEREAYRCGNRREIMDKHHGVTHSPYAAKIQCRQYNRGVRCKTWFCSPDKRSVTRCAVCRSRLFAKEELLSCDAQRYEVDAPSEGRVYTSLQRRIGRHIVSTDYRTLELQERAENYVGISFRRLTPEEIAKEYPAEKIAVMLIRAKRNRVVGWVPDERSL